METTGTLIISIILTTLRYIPRESAWIPVTSSRVVTRIPYVTLAAAKELADRHRQAIRMSPGADPTDYSYQWQADSEVL